MVFAVGEHAGRLRQAIVEYKYRRSDRWGPVLARLLAGYLTRYQPWVEEFDFLVPMPAYRGPGARRPWDPVAELTRRTHLLLPTWEVGWGAVVKVAETPPLRGRELAARVALAEGPLRRALRVPDADRVAGARVLVVDDVLTDGCSLREVARVLRAAGAAEVGGLVLARPAWRRAPAGSPTPASSP